MPAAHVFVATSAPSVRPVSMKFSTMYAPIAVVDLRNVQFVLQTGGEQELHWRPNPPLLSGSILDTAAMKLNHLLLRYKDIAATDR